MRNENFYLQIAKFNDFGIDAFVVVPFANEENAKDWLQSIVGDNYEMTTKGEEKTYNVGYWNRYATLPLHQLKRANYFAFACLFVETDEGIKLSFVGYDTFRDFDSGLVGVLSLDLPTIAKNVSKELNISLSTDDMDNVCNLIEKGNNEICSLLAHYDINFSRLGLGSGYRNIQLMISLQALL